MLPALRWRSEGVEPMQLPDWAVQYWAVWGFGLLTAGLAALWRYAAVSRRDFGGITGDLAGWFLQRCELWMLAALVAGQLLEAHMP